MERLFETRGELEAFVRDILDREAPQQPVRQTRAAFDLALGGLRIKAGVANVASVAAVFGSQVVTHGGTEAPDVVVATAHGTTGVVNVTVSDIGATQFTLRARYTDDVSRTTSQDVYWLAVWLPG